MEGTACIGCNRIIYGFGHVDCGDDNYGDEDVDHADDDIKTNRE